MKMLKMMIVMMMVTMMAPLVVFRSVESAFRLLLFQMRLQMF